MYDGWLKPRLVNGDMRSGSGAYISETDFACRFKFLQRDHIHRHFKWNNHSVVSGVSCPLTRREAILLPHRNHMASQIVVPMCTLPCA